MLGVDVLDAVPGPGFGRYGVKKPRPGVVDDKTPR